MEVVKEVISPGTYWYEDSEGNPRRFVATPEKIKHYFDSGKRMLAAGLSIPVPFEHQPHANPLTKAQRAAQQLKDNAGWVSDFELKDGVLFSKLTIEDPEVEKKLPKTIRWTSPKIDSFLDGDGQAWNEVISHVALTTRPRIQRQKPFDSIAAALSLATVEPAKSFAISRAGLLAEDGTPRHPLAFSLLSGVALAAEDLVEEKPKKKKEKPAETDEYEEGHEKEVEHEEEETVVGGSESETGPSGQPNLAAAGKGSGDVPIHTVLCGLLEIAGIHLPEETDEESFMQHAYMALIEWIKGKVGETEMAETQKPTNPIIQEQRPPYATLSLEEIQKVPDENTRSILLSLHAERQRGERLQKNAFDGAKKSRQSRVDSLLKRLTKKEAKDKLTAMAGGMQFSLGDDGAVQDEPTITLSAVLDLLDDAIVSIPQMVAGDPKTWSVQEHPKEFAGELTEERRNELVDRLERHGGHKKNGKK